MPGGDQTGPMGQGPISGRGMGYCSGSEQPGYMNRGQGRGMGRCKGGRGFGGGGWQRGQMGFMGPSNVEQPAVTDAKARMVAHDQGVADLKEKTDRMEATLQQIQSQLAALTKTGTP